MKLQNTLNEIKVIDQLAVDNNTPSVIASLRSYGYVVADDISRQDLLQLLLDIFNKDKAQWVTVIKKVRYDVNAKNYTTNADVVQSLKETAGWVDDKGNQLGNAKIDIGGIFTQIGDFIGGSVTSVTGGAINVKGNTAAAITALLVLVVIAVVIVVIVSKGK